MPHIRDNRWRVRSPRSRDRPDFDHTMGSSKRDDDDDHRMARRRHEHRRGDRGQEWRGDPSGRREDPDEFPGEPRLLVRTGHDYGAFSGNGGRGYGAEHDRDYGYGGYGGERGRAGGEHEHPRQARHRRAAYGETYRRDPDQSAMVGSYLHETYQGRYGGVAPYSKHANEHNYWAGYDEDEGSSRGKGPKGYARSDERIKEHICDVLMDDSHVDASEIDVLVKNGEVTLSGSVDNKSTKRRAEDLVEEIRGVTTVQNSLRVKHHAARRSA